MRVLITGGGGFLGTKLAAALAKKGELNGHELTHVVQSDIFAPAPVAASYKTEGIALDVSDAEAVNAALAEPFDVIFHLAAIVSGQAELEFDLGLKINLFGSLNLFEAARQRGNKPIFVYTSSCAAYGGEWGEEITDFTFLNPQTSYGAQKAAGELLLTDYSRKGFLDGRGLRLPSVTVRPGKPNAAASSFMSSIFREPLQGDTANCPVGEDYRVWNSAPRTVIANLVHAAEVPEEDWGMNRCLALPGQSVRVGGMVQAMTNVAGSNAAGLITWNEDPFIQKICEGWPQDMKTDKAIRLGFHRDKGFEDNIRWFLEDDIQKVNKPLKGKEDRGNLAILLTCITFLFFTAIDTSAKWLITAGVAVPVVVFFRYAGHLVFTVASSALQRDWSVWRMKRPGLTVLRGLLLVASTSLNFISLQYLPLTVTVSIFFTMPLMTTAIAAIFLKEKVGVRRWSAIAVGFAGVLIITQPWDRLFPLAMLVSLFVTFMATIYNILTRVLAGQESAGTMQFYAAALPCVLLAPWAFSVWTWPEGALNWTVCLIIGFFGFAGHQIWVLALRFGEASALAPFGYIQIIYMTAASWLIFNQPPGMWTVIGACVVVVSGMYVWVREQALQIRKSHRAP